MPKVRDAHGVGGRGWGWGGATAGNWVRQKEAGKADI